MNSLKLSLILFVVLSCLAVKLNGQAIPQAPVAPVPVQGTSQQLPPVAGAPQTPPCRQYHIVAPGDTLNDLSLEYDVNIDSLFAANSGVDPENLQPKSLICIP